MAVLANTSYTDMAGLTSSLMWDSIEIIISIAAIAAYSFVISHAAGLVLRGEQSLGHTNDPDVPRKEQTATYLLTGFLGGIHMVMIFFGLPLLGHGSDSILMRALFSCAILVAVTTGLIIGGIIVYLFLPALTACCSSILRCIRCSSKALDIEATTGGFGDEESQVQLLEKMSMDKE